MSDTRRHRRPFWLWPLVALVVLMCLLVVAVWLTRPVQPIYAGRPLLEWVAGLESPVATNREAAELAIAAVGTNGIPALTWALRRGDSWIGRAVMASEKSLPRRLWYSLARAARPHEAPRQRAVAAKALGRLGPQAEPALEPLANALRDRDLSVMARAAEAMSAIGPAAVPYLAGALPGASSVTRSHVLLALGRLGAAATPSAAAIAELLVTGEDSHNTTQAAHTLARIGPSTLPVLVTGLNRTNAGARERIESALANLATGQMEALLAIESALRTAPAEVRPSLLRAVEQTATYPKRRALIIARTLEDPNLALREAAGAWLRQNSSLAELERPLAGESAELRGKVADLFRTNPLPAGNSMNR